MEEGNEIGKTEGSEVSKQRVDRRLPIAAGAGVSATIGVGVIVFILFMPLFCGASATGEAYDLLSVILCITVPFLAGLVAYLITARTLESTERDRV